MAIQYPLNIIVPLREKRTYLHSTNLFDFLVARTGAQHNLNLMFRRKIEHEIEALPAAECGDVESYSARFSADTDTGKIDLVFAEKQPLKLLQRREPYNEDAVAQGSRIEDAAIFSNHDNGASLIERIVALNKKLLGHISEGTKVLLFSKVSLKSLPDNKSDLKIALKSRLGMKLFRSVILANGKEIGEIVFYGI
jgi:hypothetical protein